MPAQFRIKRRVLQVPVTDNGVVTVDVPRGYDIASLGLRVYGSVNVTGATGTAVRAEAPTQIIKRIELVADGKNTLASVPFVFLNRGNVFRKRLGSLTPPTAFAAATYAVAADAFLDRMMPDSIRPKDSNLRTAGMQLLQLRFTFGQAADLFVGAPSGSFQNMFVDIISYETVEMKDNQGNITVPVYLRKDSYQDIALTASNANQQIILPIGNLMRGVVIRGEINGEPSDAVINSVQLVSGVDVRLNVPYQDLRAMNQMDYDLPNGMPTGFVVADLMADGGQQVNITDAWDLRQASEAKVVLDVNGGNGYKVTIQTIEAIMPDNPTPVAPAPATK